MYCIVPIAGPDFFSPDYGIKPLIPYNGSTLIESILVSRSWYKDIEEYIFVLQDTLHADTFISHMKKKNIKATIVKLSKETRGALLSSAAATSVIHDFSKTIVLDLVDIEYDSTSLHPLEMFSTHNIEGIIPYFISDDPAYSYLITDENGMLVQSAEKKVISNKASGGTYFFKNIFSFMTAVTGVLKHESLYSVNNSLFVCPAYNELVKKNKRILTIEVALIQSMSKSLKSIG